MQSTDIPNWDTCYEETQQHARTENNEDIIRLRNQEVLSKEGKCQLRPEGEAGF